MPSSYALILMLLVLGTVSSTSPLPGQSLETVIGLYGETITVPCPYRPPPGDKLLRVEWWKKPDIELLEKKAGVPKADIYIPGFNISGDYSLLISRGMLEDQTEYFCDVLTQSSLSRRNSSSVVIYKRPEPPVISDNAEVLEEGVPKMLGTCVARDAHPAANLTWVKNGRPLVSDGKHVNATSTVAIDSSSGLSTTSSTLHYTATRDDANARFSCLCSHQLGTARSEPLAIAVSYLELSLSPTGRVVKTVGEPLAVEMEVMPKNANVSWTKDGERMEAAPALARLSYSDAGSYACEVSSAGLTRRRSFDLVVEGSPMITNLAQITNLTQNGAHGNNVQLACEAHGVPRPVFTWNVATTETVSSYNESDGRATEKVTVIGSGRFVSVTCSVSNRVGNDTRTIMVSSVDTSWMKLVMIGVLMALLPVTDTLALYLVYLSKELLGRRWLRGRVTGG